jgi:hypothetical protein
LALQRALRPRAAELLSSCATGPPPLPCPPSQLPPFNSIQGIATLQKHKGRWLGLQLNVQQLNWVVEL